MAAWARPAEDGIDVIIAADAAGADRDQSGAMQFGEQRYCAANAGPSGANAPAE